LRTTKLGARELPRRRTFCKHRTVSPLSLVHLVSVSIWGGVVLVEAVLELSARTDDARRHVARAHLLVDLFVELPLLVTVAATGAVLAVNARPLDTLLAIKVACGAIAIAANLACVVAVVARQRHRDDPAAFDRWRARVLLSGTAIPFGLAAAAIGVARLIG
jgi:hypothetical protein